MRFTISARGAWSFVPVDCAAIPDQVFENEMFGHVRGGYTDAHTDQRGLVAIADGGTLFLDEVDSLSSNAQAKLLRFVQERTYKPLGASKFCGADLNILAATNRQIETCVRDRLFRQDLYFRLNVLQLWLPPLRQRPLDIPLLAKYFLENLEPRPPVRLSFTASALRKLSSYKWPGNVRELNNVVQRAALSAEGPSILPEHIDVCAADPLPPPPTKLNDRKRAIQTYERAYLEELLRNNNGNVSQAAIQAQCDRRSIGRLIKKYQIDRNNI